MHYLSVSIPLMNADCNPVEQQLRQDHLDRLYEEDGRHDPAHPFHAVYTGLVYKPDEAPRHA